MRLPTPREPIDDARWLETREARRTVYEELRARTHAALRAASLADSQAQELIDDVLGGQRDPDEPRLGQSAGAAGGSGQA